MNNDENVTPTNPDDNGGDPTDFLAPESSTPTPEEVPTVPGDEPPVPGDEPPVPGDEPPAPGNGPENPESPDDSAAAREKSIEELNAERAKLEEEAQALTDEIAAKDAKADEFADWVERHRRTFLWKMLAKMREQQEAVIAKQNSYVAIMDSIELPEPGELVRLRKRFHKTILSIFGGSFLIWLVYFLITTFLPFAWVLKFTSFGSLIFRYTLYVALVTIFGALVLYYRDWRRFDWRVRKLNNQLENVAKGVDKVRQEEVRLVSLYPQVVDWLEILGYSLNRPWTMNDRWFKSYISDLNQDEFPFSLRIAQAQESDASSMNKLHGSTMKRFAVRG